MKKFKPTKEDLLKAVDKTVPDVIAPNLKVLFCGINPGLYTAAIGHHFGRPGNRFWKALCASGLTKEVIDPFEETKLLSYNFGITNIVERATLSDSELSKKELVEGRKILEEKISKFKPRWIAILGIGAYRKAFDKKNANVGERDKIGDTRAWLLPNPSGLNANFRPDDLTKVFSDFRIAVEKGQ